MFRMFDDLPDAAEVAAAYDLGWRASVSDDVWVHLIHDGLGTGWFAALVMDVAYYGSDDHPHHYRIQIWDKVQNAYTSLRLVEEVFPRFTRAEDL